MWASARGSVAGLLMLVVTLSCGGLLFAEGPAPKTLDVTEPRIEPIPVPADPELEQLMREVQEGLNTIHQQMVRRKEALNKTQDPVDKAKLLEEFESLRKEREELEQLLHDLVDEAKISEQTAIDEALARARYLERQQEYQEKKEELIRDRQQ